MLVLPIDQRFSQFTFSCELDGIAYTFTFRFNDRDSTWELDLADAEGAALASGLCALTGVPLLRALRSLPGLLEGELIVIDSSAPSASAGATDPTFDSLGRRHKMFYITADELAALGV